MRWVCPGCGSEVSVALVTCPTCGSSEQGKTPSSAAPQSTASAASPEREPTDHYPVAPPTAEEPVAAVAPAVAKAPPQRLLPVPRPQAEAGEEREGPFLRGVKFGIGFMFAVAMILLLLAMWLAWLRQKGWQPWLEGGPP